MADIITAVSALFNGLLNIITSLLLPTGGLTPVATLAWFGLLFPAVALVLGFIRSLARARGGD